MEQETYRHDTFLSPFTWRYGSQESSGNGWEQISGFCQFSARV